MTSHNRYYQSDHIEEARLIVLNELGDNIPQISVQEFLGRLAPRPPQFNVKGAMEMLKASACWDAFNIEPKKQLRTEDAIFKPMEDIFKKTVDAIILNSNLSADKCLVEFLQNPNMTPISYQRDNRTKPDGYLVRKEKAYAPDISWADIMLSCEYKRHDGPDHLDDDVRKVVWSMQHIMREDPCHRATFGMTIENTTTRLWFCCRTAVIVSESFDFILEPTILIKVFATFAFADMRSLGLDTTMERIGDSKSPQFIITVNPVSPDGSIGDPRRFCTQRDISMYGAEPLRGRGTRVFEVVEIDKNGMRIGEEVVLKDSWIDSDRMREGTILAALLAKAENMDKALVRQYFLTTICHGDVQMEPRLVDNTFEGLMHKLTTPANHFQLQHAGKYPRSVTKHIVPSGSQGLRAISRLDIPPRIGKYEHKTHYRIVFKEKGITIDAVRKFRDIMNILIGTVNALQLMQRLGWVHRDISIGNILSCDGEPKLVDLEYAKHLDNNESHDMRTGTMHFMSIESAMHRFLFQPRHPYLQGEQLAWSHNHLHDLESVWWVTTWIVFFNSFRDPENPEETFTGILDNQLRGAISLFPPVMGRDSRSWGFTDTGTFLDSCLKLSSNNYTTHQYLDRIRFEIVQEYERIEATLPHKLNFSDDPSAIYQCLKDTFTLARDNLPDFDLSFIPDLMEMPK